LEASEFWVKIRARTFTGRVTGALSPLAEQKYLMKAERTERF